MGESHARQHGARAGRTTAYHARAMPAMTVTEHIDKASSQDRQVNGDRSLGSEPRAVRRRGVDGRGAREKAHSEAFSTACSTARRRSVIGAMVARRVNGEPIPRIKGHYTFRGLDLLVRDGVFVPRASSELLAEEAIKALRRRRGQRVAVDVATGAGPVALAVANEVRALMCGVLTSRWTRPRSARTTRAVSGFANAHFRAGRSPRRAAAPAARQHRCLHHPPPVRAARRPEGAAARDPGVRAARSRSPTARTTGSGWCAGSRAEAHEWLRPGGVLLVEVGTYLSRRTQATLRAAGLVDVGMDEGRARRHPRCLGTYAPGKSAAGSLMAGLVSLAMRDRRARMRPRGVRVAPVSL